MTQEANIDQRLYALVVDDDKICQIVTKYILEQLGFLVVLAGDGKEAVELVKMTTIPYRLIVMDFNMPKMNGIEATKAIRQYQEGKGSSIIIGLTAHVDDETLSECLKAGMNLVKSKPITLDDFKHLVVESSLH